MIDISAAGIEAYERDGVIALRGQFDGAWIARARAAIDRAMAAPAPTAAEFNAAGTPGRFFGDMFMWLRDADLRACFLAGPAPEIAAKAMRSRNVDAFYDQLFVKEPGTEKRTPWHQDQPYWPVLGWQVTTVYVALDRIDPANGAVEYIRGSHRWNTRFRPVGFKDGPPNAHAERYADSPLPPIPDIEADRGAYDIVTFDLEPGDCLLFHAMIAHGAPGNASSTRRRRALSMRYTGDDARYDPRPGTFQLAREPDLARGAAMTCDLFPRVWPRP